MENENITLNEASIFYKRIDKDTYLIGKDKDSYGQFLIEDAIAPLLFSSINEINRKKMTTDSLSPDRRFIFYFYLMTLYFPKSIASIWSSQIHSYFEYVFQSERIEVELFAKSDVSNDGGNSFGKYPLPIKSFNTILFPYSFYNMN